MLYYSKSPNIPLTNIFYISTLAHCVAIVFLIDAHDTDYGQFYSLFFLELIITVLVRGII